MTTKPEFGLIHIEEHDVKDVTLSNDFPTIFKKFVEKIKDAIKSYCHSTEESEWHEFFNESDFDITSPHNIDWTTSHGDSGLHIDQSDGRVAMFWISGNTNVDIYISQTDSCE